MSIAGSRRWLLGQLEEVHKVAEQRERDGALVLFGLARLGRFSKLLRDCGRAIADLIRHTGQGGHLRAVRRLGDSIDETVSVGQGKRNQVNEMVNYESSNASNRRIGIATHVKITSRLSSSTSTCMCLLLTREYESKSYARLV